MGGAYQKKQAGGISPYFMAAGSLLEALRKPRGRTPHYTLMQAPWQTAGINRMTESLARPYEPSRMTNMANDELTKVLMGGYNPYLSPVYQTERVNILNEQGQGLTGMKRGQQKTGTLYGGPTREAEATYRASTQNRLAQILAGQYGEERRRQFSAIPLAEEYGKAEQEYNHYLDELAESLYNATPTYTPSKVYSSGGGASDILMELSKMFMNAGK